MPPTTKQRTNVNLSPCMLSPLWRNEKGARNEVETRKSEEGGLRKIGLLHQKIKI